jgi:hypothetical protein
MYKIKTDLFVVSKSCLPVLLLEPTFYHYMCRVHSVSCLYSTNYVCVYAALFQCRLLCTTKHSCRLSTLSCYELCTVISTWFLHFLHFIWYRNVPKFCVCVILIKLLISCLLFFHVCIRIYFAYLFCSLLCFFFTHTGHVSHYVLLLGGVFLFLCLQNTQSCKTPTWTILHVHITTAHIVLSHIVVSQHNVKVRFLSPPYFPCNCHCIQLHLVQVL